MNRDCVLGGIGRMDLNTGGLRRFPPPGGGRSITRLCQHAREML